MRLAVRLVAPLESAVRTLPSSSARRPFVCHSCKARLKAAPAHRLQALPKRTIATSAVRKADALVPEEVAEESYEPAHDWGGLEWIGSKDWVYARDSRQVDTERFGETTIGRTSKKLRQEDILLIAFRRAIIESLLLDEANVTGQQRQDILDNSKRTPLRTSRIGVRVNNETGAFELVHKNREFKETIVQRLGVPRENMQDFQTRRLTQAEAYGWRYLNLLDSPDRKFEVLKRVTQLTSITFPDHTITSARSAEAIMKNLQKHNDKQPLTVLEALASDKKLEKLNNVTVYGKRQTFIDRDVAKGRWKIIEEELVGRGLPLPRKIATQRRRREAREARRAEA